MAILPLIALFLTAFASSQGFFLQRETRALCPNVTTKADFNYIPYAGLWYENRRFESVFEAGSGCERAIYEEISLNYLSVVNTAVLKDGSLYNITGTARPLPNEPGHLVVEFPGRPPGKYLVLDTNYNSWASVYSCTQAGAQSLEYAWLLSRNQTISDTDLQTALSAFTKFGINVSQFNVTRQGSSCIYCPDYPYVSIPPPPCVNP